MIDFHSINQNYRVIGEKVSAMCELSEQLRRLPLNVLKAFYLTAKCGSVTQAAEQLYLTHSAVSKQLQQLEQALGITLWQKEGRYLRLTAAGQRLLQGVEGMFAQLSLTLQALHLPSNRPLVLSCEPTIAMRWLIPRLAQLREVCGSEITILCAGGAVNFAQQGIDLAIRRQDFTVSDGVYCAMLAKEQMAAVLAPHGRVDCQLHSQSRLSAWQTWGGRWLCFFTNATI